MFFLQIDPDTLQEISDEFRTAVQARLSQRVGSHFYISSTFDSFRRLFHNRGKEVQKGGKLLQRDDFNGLLLPEDWDIFVYTKLGEGRAVSFTIKVTPTLRWSKNALE